MSLPILYSFRRCPYAMRAEWLLLEPISKLSIAAILHDRPEHMMKISLKGTVPVMLLPDGTVIEESLEIMEYVQSWDLTQDERNWVNRNDDEFKFH